MASFVLSDSAEFAYKCTDFYHPNDEGGLAYNDPVIAVEWPIPEGMELILSDKDKKWGSFQEYSANRSKRIEKRDMAARGNYTEQKAGSFPGQK